MTSYEIDYLETDEGVYWVLYRDGARMNGGLQESYTRAATEAVVCTYRDQRLLETGSPW